MTDLTLEQRIENIQLTAKGIATSIRSETSLVHRLFYRVTKQQPQEELPELVDKYMAELKEISQVAKDKAEEKRDDIKELTSEQSKLKSYILREETGECEINFFGGSNGHGYRDYWENDHKKDLLERKLTQKKERTERYQAEEGILRIQAQTYEKLDEHTFHLLEKLSEVIRYYKTVEDEKIYTNTLKESIRSLLSGTAELKGILKNKNKILKDRSKSTVNQTIINDENLPSTISGCYLE